MSTHWTRRYRLHAIMPIICTTSSFCQKIIEQALLVVHMPAGAPIRRPYQDISGLILAEANGTAVRSRCLPSRKLDHPACGCIIIGSPDSFLQVNDDCCWCSWLCEVKAATIVGGSSKQEQGLSVEVFHRKRLGGR